MLTCIIKKSNFLKIKRGLIMQINDYNSGFTDISKFDKFDCLVKDVKEGKLVTSEYTSVEKYSKFADFFVRLFSFGHYSLEKHYNCNIENVFKKIEVDVNLTLSAFGSRLVVKKVDVDNELMKISKVLAAIEENKAEIKFNFFSGLIENVPELNADSSHGSYSFAHLFTYEKLSDEEVNKEISDLINSAGLSSKNIKSSQPDITKGTLKVFYGGGSDMVRFKEIKLSEKLKRHFIPKKFDTKEQIIEKLKELKLKGEFLQKNTMEDPAIEFKNLKNSLLERIAPLMSIITEKERIEKTKKDSLVAIYNRVLNSLKSHNENKNVAFQAGEYLEGCDELSPSSIRYLKQGFI